MIIDQAAVVASSSGSSKSPFRGLQLKFGGSDEIGDANRTKAFLAVVHMQQKIAKAIADSQGKMHKIGLSKGSSFFTTMATELGEIDPDFKQCTGTALSSFLERVVNAAKELDEFAARATSDPLQPTHFSDIAGHL